MVQHRIRRRLQIIRLAIKLYRISRRVKRLGQSGTDPAEVDVLYASAGQAIRETACNLKGVIVKAGQFLSLRQELFPPAFTQELQGLQDDVPPAPYDRIRAILEQDMKRPLAEVFVKIETDPVASASISQVHRAVLVSGETVAVKVLRPGIEALAAIDLSTLGKVVRILARLPGISKKMDFVTLHGEFCETIGRELDMLCESGNMERFRNEYGYDARIVIPKVFDEYTTKRVLVMEYIDGANLRDRELLMEWGVDLGAVRDTLLDVYLKQILLNGFIHLDPHPGNLAVLPDGRLALLDFGMVDELSLAEMKAIRRLVQHAFLRDVPGVVDAMQELGYLHPDANKDDFVRSVGPRLGRFDAVGLRALWQNDAFRLQAKYMLLIRCLGLLKTVLAELTPEETDWFEQLEEHALPVMMSAPRE